MPPVPPHIMAAQILRPEQIAPAIFCVMEWSILADCSMGHTIA
jgi:hypothetical protein